MTSSVLVPCRPAKLIPGPAYRYGFEAELGHETYRGFVSVRVGTEVGEACCHPSCFCSID
jgi:hypothetical protein